METHKELTERLKKIMRTHDAVHIKRNPLARGLKDISTEGLENAVSQYTIFPRNIVSFLYSARDKAKIEGWKEVATELTRNMGEELGTETNGATHYEMLIRGIAQGINPSLENQLRNLQPSPSTDTFIKDMKEIIGDFKAPAPYVLGGTYALETSAVPELVIVRRAVNELFTRKTGKPMQDGKLKDFFKYHLGTWEPGHEEGLRDTTAIYVKNQPDQILFENGFKDVMYSMDWWWTGLYQESKTIHKIPGEIRK
ncbi:MAG: DUF3865 domain-containing protein [Nanoarchaeota archaeon]|nr:DUF3865 domain-containing protein [Nanoarchaeota archaeon]